MEEIIRYYEMVCELVPDIGMIVYNIPQFTGIEFNKENAGRILSNPQIIGVKHTSNNLYALERMKAAYPDKVFFNGFDEQLVGAFAMGVDATIGTTVNVLPHSFGRRAAFSAQKKLPRLLLYNMNSITMWKQCVRLAFSAL